MKNFSRAILTFTKVSLGLGGTLSLGLIFWVPKSLAENFPLSLQEAIAQAESQSPDLLRLQATVQRVNATKMEALSGYLPHITAGYDHFLTSTYERENVVFEGTAISFPAAFPQDNITVDVSLTVFDGFEALYKYRAASLNSEAALLELSREKFKVEEAVRSAFYQALAAQKLLEVSRQNVKTLQDHLDKAKLTERSGYGTQFDVLRIDANLAEATAEQQNAENNVRTARDALSLAMGLENEDRRPLAGDLPVLQENDIPADLSINFSDRDDLQSVAKRVDASQMLASAANSFWYPSVSVFAEEQFYKFGNFDPSVEGNGSLQNASFFGLRLRWNLFDGGSSYSRQQQAHQASVEAGNQNRKVLLEAPREFEIWKNKFNYSVMLYRARLHALALNQESVRLASLGVKSGTRTHTEMLDAELDLFRARAGLVRAQADAIEAIGRLELATGRKIWRTATAPN